MGGGPSYLLTHRELPPSSAALWNLLASISSVFWFAGQQTQQVCFQPQQTGAFSEKAS